MPYLRASENEFRSNLIGQFRLTGWAVVCGRGVGKPRPTRRPVACGRGVGKSRTTSRPVVYGRGVGKSRPTRRPVVCGRRSRKPSLARSTKSGWVASHGERCN